MKDKKEIPVLCEAVTTYVPKVNPVNLPLVNAATDVVNLLLDSWDEVWHYETFKVLLLNHSHRVLGVKTIGQGGIAMCPVDIKLVLQAAITGNATNVIIVHNHPSGSTAPSEQDDILTQRIWQACKAVDVNLLDHVIIAGDGTYYGYADNGKIIN